MAAAPAVEVVERLLIRARAHGASDLHLEPGEEGVVVTLRRDGVLLPVETLPRTLGPHVVGRLKALADLLAYRTDIPQEGRIPADRSGIEVEVRVGTYPTLLGERVALRLDAPDGRPRDLRTLGLPPAIEAELCAAIEQPEGIVLLTGPSGSGKTTTLYSCLHHLAAQEPRRSLVTIEDPVERRVRGVTQTEVNPAAGLTFSRALRSLLRQDPDVILVGEIRDRETAAIALEAGLTGHLVLSTVHAGTAPQVFARLLEMGVEPFVATTAVRGVLAQRLLRRRCRDDVTGYAGRVLAAEWITMDASLRRAVLDRADGEELARAAYGRGRRTLRQEALELVEHGATTQEEVERVLGRD
ncbi:MAG: GspE/PulE family protein [Planctomycetota bacterium]|jgi:type II secretory ATPase GspE/PulE/Tfp pilus assembly ATPase PilB-like protein